MSPNPLVYNRNPLPIPAAPGWPLTRVISGGQTGVDQAGISAAKFTNYLTGGMAPKGWLTEDGPAPWLEEFGLSQSAVISYKSRTHANVVNSDATVIFTPAVLTWGGKKEKKSKLAETHGEGHTSVSIADLLDSYDLVEGSGSRYTATLAIAHRKELCINPESPEFFRQWIYNCGAKTLNVAGARESRAPGIFGWCYDFLIDGLIPF